MKEQKKRVIREIPLGVKTTVALNIVLEAPKNKQETKDERRRNPQR